VIKHTSNKSSFGKNKHIHEVLIGEFYTLYKLQLFSPLRRINESFRNLRFLFKLKHTNITL